ncbi:MAG: tRNA (guanosine(37)-N1)-methyltransferase TrmD [Thermotogae bacterium]|nr:tRNA (guanosine(37)-N1)-methyltransferase TrmD [Thermotogota bacterium]MCL5033187.1 tRNA (guanosine(37)-N1)-methyltransferase TrmD [Thermotogota bacterium]
MNIEVVTTIPELFDQFKEYGIIGRAIKTGKINFDVINLRNYAHDLHKTTDDYAYGTGVGMVMKVEPVFEMFDEYLKSHQRPWIVYPSPQGETFDQSKAFELSQKNDVMFICGRYEGVDERIMSIVDEEISIGDFVISGGEAITMVFVEAMARMIPGVVGKEVSVENDSFFSGLLDHANYTRPRSYRGMDVPEVLRSGDHAKVGKYLLKDAIKRTIEKRPDLFLKRDLSFEEKAAIIALLREKKEC